MQGEYLVTALPENAKIIYFTGAPNDQQYIDRKAGLMDKLATRADVTVLAEYNVENKKDLGMLPASTGRRKARDGLKKDGRGVEIQRLIGRSLRQAVDMTKLGECTITLDCDVLQADGGTRTASITGAYVALVMAINKRMNSGLIAENPMFIDCPPSLGLLTVNALSAAQRVLIPIQCEYYALEGVSSLVNTINRVKHSFNPGLDIEGVLLTMLDGRTNLSLQVVDSVKKHFKTKGFSTAIPRNVRLGEAPSHGQPIHVYDPRSIGAESYRDLARELLDRNE